MKAEFGDGSMNVLQRDRIPKHLAVTLCNYSYSDTEKATVAKLEKTEKKTVKKGKIISKTEKRILQKIATKTDSGAGKLTLFW